MEKSVLIADDDPFIQELLGFVVEDQGYRHIICKTGRDVVRTLQSQPVDLLVLDVLLPQMSGIDVLKQLKRKKLLERTPAVLITGVYSPVELKQRLGKELSTMKTLYKPLSLNDFQELLSNYLGSSHQVKYIFPHCIEKKPGFEKRVKKDKFETNSDSDGKIPLIWFIPKSGRFADYRFLHILLQLRLRGKSWRLEFKTDSRKGYLGIENGQITHFHSDLSRDIASDSPTDKFRRFTRDVFSSNACRHMWLNGIHSTPFKRMIYDLATDQTGVYALKEMSEEPEEKHACRHMDILELIHEGFKGSFPDALIRKSVLLPKGQVVMCDHVLSSCRDLCLSDAQKSLLEILESDNTIEGVMKSAGQDRLLLYNALFSLWLIGSLDIVQRYTDIHVEVAEKKNVIARKPAPKPERISPVATKQNEMDSLITKIRRMYQFGLAGRYYDFLDIDIDDESDKINSQIDRMGIWLRTTKLPAGIERKVNDRLTSLTMILKEARCVLADSKHRRSYNKVLKETKGEKKIKLAKQHYQIGLNCISQENHVRGIAEMKMCVYLQPDNKGAFEHILTSMRVYPEYFAMLCDLAKRAVRIDEYNPYFKVVLGYCYMELGNNRDAEKLFKKILDMDPDNVEAMHFLLELPGYDKNLGFTVE